MRSVERMLLPSTRAETIANRFSSGIRFIVNSPLYEWFGLVRRVAKKRHLTMAGDERINRNGVCFLTRWRLRVLGLVAVISSDRPFYFLESFLYFPFFNRFWFWAPA